MNLYTDILIGVWIRDNWTEINKGKEDFKIKIPWDLTGGYSRKSKHIQKMSNIHLVIIP